MFETTQATATAFDPTLYAMPVPEGVDYRDFVETPGFDGTYAESLQQEASKVEALSEALFTISIAHYGTDVTSADFGPASVKATAAPKTIETFYAGNAGDFLAMQQQLAIIDKAARERAEMEEDDADDRSPRTWLGKLALGLGASGRKAPKAKSTVRPAFTF